MSSWLSRSERCLRTCVVLNSPGSSPALTINFLSQHLTSYRCFIWTSRWSFRRALISSWLFQTNIQDAIYWANRPDKNRWFTSPSIYLLSELHLSKFRNPQKSVQASAKLICWDNIMCYYVRWSDGMCACIKV